MEKNHTILIAGGHGVAGSAIVRLLEKKGFTNVFAPNHMELDLCSFEAVDRFFADTKPNYVFYVAAKMGSITYRNNHPVELLLENLSMQMNVIRCAHTYRVKKLLFMSSDFIYPETESGILKEENFLTGLPSKRDFPYSLAKITGVKLCDYYREEYADDFFTVVPCAFFGLNSSFDIERANVVTSMIHRMHDAKLIDAPEFMLWGTGRPIKEFLFSEDIASACFLLMEQDIFDGLYNIGSGDGGISIMELANLIKETIGYEGKIVCDCTKPDGVLRRVPDSTRLQALGWKPVHDLKDSIAFMYDYFLTLNK